MLLMPPLRHVHGAEPSPVVAWISYNITGDDDQAVLVFERARKAWVLTFNSETGLWAGNQWVFTKIKSGELKVD